MRHRVINLVSCSIVQYLSSCIIYRLSLKLDLQFREPFWHQNYLVEETVTCMVTEGVGQIDHTLLLHGQNADAIRQMFKNESETYLLTVIRPLYYNMCLTDNFSEKELSEYFTDSKIKLSFRIIKT